jgi:hypothetical protein
MHGGHYHIQVSMNLEMEKDNWQQNSKIEKRYTYDFIFPVKRHEVQQYVHNFNTEIR